MISPKSIDDIRELPIEQVLEKFMTLKRAGNNMLKGLCPMPNHNEKTPSFTVYQNKNTFTCYGCGAHGDAIEFVMRKENLPFLEACQRIASDNGITLEQTEVKGKTPEQKADELSMMDLLHQAQVTYSKLLIQNGD
jgi:DNA primase